MLQRQADRSVGRSVIIPSVGPQNNDTYCGIRGHRSGISGGHKQATIIDRIDSRVSALRPQTVRLIFRTRRIQTQVCMYNLSYLPAAAHPPYTICMPYAGVTSKAAAGKQQAQDSRQRGQRRTTPRWSRAPRRRRATPSRGRPEPEAPRRRREDRHLCQQAAADKRRRP